MKIKKIFLLSLLVLLLVGVSYAAEANNDTTTTSDTPEVVKDTSSTTNIVDNSINEEIKKDKEITKQVNTNKTTKASRKTYDVKDFDTLHNALTDDTYDAVTVNIKSNIMLTDNTELNEAIKTLIINGNGKTITGDNTYQFLKINSGEVTIKNIKISNCYSESYGGAIYNQGTLAITNSTLNNNNALWSGAIYNENGTVNITNSTLNNNTAIGADGAIHNYYGILDITDSTLNNNNGRAIYNENGTVNITDSTLNYNNGGAIYNDYGILDITDSTLNNNNATRGGAIYNKGNLLINNSKFTKNNAKTYHGGTSSNSMEQDGSGAAIFTINHTVNIYNSIFSRNNASYWGGVISCFNSKINIYNTTISNNIAYDANILYGEKSTVIINNSIVNKNNKNNLFQGRFTRNSLRNENGKIFIYNSEMDNNGLFVTSTDTKIYNSSFNNNRYGQFIYEGNLSIENSTFKNNTGGEVISLPYESQLNSIININNSIFENNKGSIELTGDITVSDSIFNNNKNENYILSCDGMVRLTNLKFNNNNQSQYSPRGVVYLIGKINADNLLFNNNTASDGIVLLQSDSNLTITNSNFTNNNAGKGMICSNGENLIVDNCIFKDNYARYPNIHAPGSAINNNYQYNNLTVRNSIFINNTAYNGAAIYNNGYLTVNNSVFQKNTALNNGGAIYSILSGYEIYNSNITDNKAGNNGGAIYSEGTDSPEHDDINQSYINEQRKWYHTKDNIISGNNFSNNMANNSGGAIYDSRFNNIIKSNTFSYNTAKNGSAIYNNYTRQWYQIIGYKTEYDKTGKPYQSKIINGTYSTIGEGNNTITNNTFIKNKANQDGTAIIINGTNTTIKNNTRDDTSIDSSTIYIVGENILISNNIFYDGRTLFKHTYMGNVNIGTTVKVVGRLLSEDTGNAIKYAPVTIKINNKTYKLKTDGAGYVKLNYTINDYNNQKITFKYAGNGNYLPCTNTTTFKVKQPTRIKMANMANVKYGSTVKLVGRLLYNGTTAVKYTLVNVTVNGKTYKVKTDGAGYIRLNYTVNNYDNQKVTFKFAGNTLYLASSNSTMFKVKQPTWIKHASISKVKQGSTVKIVGRVLYNGTNSVKYVPVNVTVNGKVYKLKTDGAGYYRLNYTATTLGTVTFTSKFAGNTLYLASTNSTKFTVVKS